MAFISLQTLIISLILILSFIYLIYLLFRKKKIDYSSKNYWEKRYRNFEERMEWYTGFNQLNQDFLLLKIFEDKYQKNRYKKKLLELGCGDSTLCDDLYNNDYKNITAIDFSTVVINKMKRIYKTKKIKFEVCDFNNLKMNYGKNSFDIIYEKAGFDSMLSKWENDMPDLVFKIFNDIHYILRDGGIFLSFSSRNTDFWNRLVFNRLNKEKLFKLKESKTTTCKIKGLDKEINLYFAYLIKL